jgi:hypothetical protein
MKSGEPGWIPTTVPAHKCWQPVAHGRPQGHGGPPSLAQPIGYCRPVQPATTVWRTRALAGHRVQSGHGGAVEERWLWWRGVGGVSTSGEGRSHRARWWQLRCKVGAGRREAAGFSPTVTAMQWQPARKRLGAGPRASWVPVDHLEVSSRGRRSGGGAVDAGNVEVAGTRNGGAVGASSSHWLWRGRGQW